jgi:hypothetical protein
VTNTPAAGEQEAKKAAAIDAAAIDAERLRRWDALSPEEQAEAEATFERENPRPPLLHPRHWAKMRRTACIARMMQEEPVQ